MHQPDALHISQLQNCSRYRVKRDDKQIYKVVADGSFHIVKCVKCTFGMILLIPCKKRIRMIKKRNYSCRKFREYYCLV